MPGKIHLQTFKTKFSGIGFHQQEGNDQQDQPDMHLDQVIDRGFQRGALFRLEKDQHE